MSIYLPGGWVDMEKIAALGYPFTFVLGGRGTGKTYGALEDVREHNVPFMLMRRSQGQADLIKTPDFNPFRSVDSKHEYHTLVTTISKYNAAFYDGQPGGEDGTLVPAGSPLGYTCALSTFSNIRGFDASHVERLIFDEFIPERHEKPITNEAEALFNAYETINRNRELEGRQPLQLLALSNANDLGNPIFLYLKLVRQAEWLYRKGRELWTDDKRGICLCILQGSPISEAKRQTALYKLTAGSEFSQMSLDNEFSHEDRSRTKSMPLQEYRPLVAVGELCIYRHKSKRAYYATTHVSGTPPTFGSGPVELDRFQKAYRWVWQEYLMDNLTFEDALSEILLRKYFKD